MVKKLLPFIFVFFALFSCKKKDESSDRVTWIGGQIVNPKLDYIIFAQGKHVLDTVKLDSNNFFLYRTDKIKEGLYTLRHNETQVFYIQPGDSLLLHLNTLEFDESLAYSGKGAAQNNLLMDLYLKNERENKFLPKWYTLSPKEFTMKIDSIKAEKKAEYQDFLIRNQVSEGFKEVAEASIKYDYFSKKELYAMANRSRLDILGDDYFDYRKNIDFDKEKLRYYYPYYRFLNRYFNSMLIAKYPPGVDRNSYNFSVDKIKAIDSVISNDSIKNSLLRYTAYRYLFCAKDSIQEKEFLDLFTSLNNNAKHTGEIEKLTKATIRLSGGNLIPDVQLVSMGNNIKNIRQVVNRPTVLYFWTYDNPGQARMVHNRAAELKSKYPEYDFLGINTDPNFKKWRNLVQNMKLDESQEFQLENLAESEKVLVLSTISKAIILDKNSVILDGNTNMFNSNFEQLLLGLLNR
ncbi:hypothetical protein EI546_02995 [Aequorivita sp. H23M31]|uniref:Thioredoxin-like fold domain-containing protein n=1 Tax=Aequorivita ciconiae TaxID=2494375 RepID=A0A410G0I4_9FLAO|nr:thioredoxin-like domain-containing protein [Aequorivita sp. H23M31]QAA80759.1 hypothetical protein EI546_02995 [Aequorivita sp. H23M31]